VNQELKVVQFPAHPAASTGREWQSGEVQTVVDACAASISRGHISGWALGTTEAGDPQLYLLGPAPDHDCVLCISRLGRLYVLEDGQGHVVFEHDAMSILAEQVRGTLRKQKSAIAARAVAAWLAVKETFEERVEPVLAEPMEVFTHVAPQLAALV
jgi:hypothetical protein